MPKICHAITFVKLTLKAVYLTMLGEKIKINSVQITTKCICQLTKIESSHFSSCLPPGKKSTPGYYHPLGRKKLLISCFFFVLFWFFFKNLFPRRNWGGERGREETMLHQTYFF